MKATDLLRLHTLVRRFRSKGHQVATLDPLFHANHDANKTSVRHWRVDKKAQHLAQMMSTENAAANLRHSSNGKDNSTIDLSDSGFTEGVTADTVVPTDALLEVVGPHWRQMGLSLSHDDSATSSCSCPPAAAGPITVGDVLRTMHSAYCRNVSAEFVHVQTVEQFEWLSSRLECFPVQSPTARRNHWKSLARAVYFERFLRTKYNASKTYGLMGCEALIPGIHALCARASALGVEHMEFGMAHRGRLSVLANVMQKPMGMLFDEFNDDGVTASVADVKYHLGARASIWFDGNPDRGAAKTKTTSRSIERGVLETGQRNLRLSLVPNPSHLELVNPVVLGKTRAVQHFMRDKHRGKAMAVMLHGDAAFSGQGITAETLELSQLPDYTTGGSVHVIINNQIGFTTDPHISRSSLHPTGAATAIGAPVFHVNGDDVDNVARVFELAAEYRQRFREDCVVDIVCYRREGHNELDDPTMTQPSVYRAIQNHPTTLDLYEQSLAEDGLINLPQDSDRLLSETQAAYERDFQEARNRSVRSAWSAEREEEGNDADKTTIEAASKTEQRKKSTSSSFSAGAPDRHFPRGARLVRSQSNSEWLSSNWKGKALGDMMRRGDRPFNMTGVRLNTLKEIGRALGTKSRALQALNLSQSKWHADSPTVNDILKSPFLLGDAPILPIDIHPKVAKMMDARASKVLSGKGIDMATAEALALGALALPLRGDEEADSTVATSGAGYADHHAVHVRLSGQDSERGTFNQRHAIVVCQLTERRFSPLNSIGVQRGEKEDGVYYGGNDEESDDGEEEEEEEDEEGEEKGGLNLSSQPLTPATIAAATILKSQHSRSLQSWDNMEDPWGQESVKIANSNLSEAAALAFEYGHSLENERCLTIWEAQFGDFANNAQAVIDNMIINGEDKWNQSSGLGEC
jgi:2-oxoglutarate dehydrogenase complex dehydrogenase (E1) component-like enzyme